MKPVTDKQIRVGGKTFTLTIDGLEYLQSMMEALNGEASRIIGRAVNEEVQLLAAAAITRTPKHLGYLRASQQIIGPVNQGGDYVESQIIYGNAQAWYAWLVHEREFTATGKPINYRVGGAKYLTKTLDAAMPTLGDRIGRRTQAIIDGLI